MAPGITGADKDFLQLRGNFADMLTRTRTFECKENILSMWESFDTPNVRPPPPPPPPPLPPPNPEPQ